MRVIAAAAVSVSSGFVVLSVCYLVVSVALPAGGVCAGVGLLLLLLLRC
jgi:hypothetical protein